VNLLLTASYINILTYFTLLTYAKDDTAVERFVGFVDVHDTTGAVIAETIWNFVDDLGLDAMLIRGQGYDGASNMSGYFRGIAAQIQSMNPLALYTHCCCSIWSL